ncbi:MAG: FG-GAP repeat protein [Steroidobacteraceae bacterium]
MRRKRSWTRSVLLTAAALAAGCGGGGGGDGVGNPPPPVDPPGAAVLSLEIGLKQLRFTWPAVSGATSYQLLANPDGGSGFTQLGADIPGGDTGVDVDVSVHQHDWPNARYVLDACNAGGCTGSNEVGTAPGDALEAIGYFKNSNHEAGDNIGAVALSADGMTMAIGAPSEDSAATGVNGDQLDDSASAAGAVYVFHRIDGEWAQQAYLKASNTGTNDNFGVSVAVSADGSTLAVGAMGESSGATGVGGGQADNSVTFSGAVYVFVQDEAGSWTQQAYVKASNPDPSDFFGSRVALSGDGGTLAVSADEEDSAATGFGGMESDNSAAGAGAVYVFARDPAGDWSQQAYVKASNTDATDGFGDNLALDGSGNTLVVAAINEDSAATGIDGDQDDDSSLNAGAAYVLTRDAGGSWSQQAYVKAPNTDSADSFGWAVALSDDGNTLLVAAPGEDSSATGVNGNQANNSVGNAGAAYVYARVGETWTFQSYFKASNPEVGDLFGFGLALSHDGNTIAVNAGNEDSGASGIDGNQADNNVDAAGAVYVFRRDDGLAPWSQRAYVKASNPDDSDFFGSELALSADGSTLAALSRTEESAATGIGGNQNDNTAPFAGAVWLY